MTNTLKTALALLSYTVAVAMAIGWLNVEQDTSLQHALMLGAMMFKLIGHVFLVTTNTRMVGDTTTNQGDTTTRQWWIVFNSNQYDTCVVEASSYDDWLMTHQAIKDAVEAKVGQCRYDTWAAYCAETGDYETESEI